MALIPDDWLESHPEFIQEIARQMQLDINRMTFNAFTGPFTTAQAAPTEEYICEKCGRRFPAPLYGRSVIHDCGIVIDVVAVDVPESFKFVGRRGARFIPPNLTQS